VTTSLQQAMMEVLSDPAFLEALKAKGFDAAPWRATNSRASRSPTSTDGEPSPRTPTSRWTDCAIGIRLRSVPFRRDKVLAALKLKTV
jgi:hypothetical protein